MVINKKFLGKEYPETSFQIGFEKHKEFLTAVKANQEKFSQFIFPTFPVVFQSELLSGVLFDPEIKLNLAKLVHGEQEFIFHKPISIGDTIKTKGKIENIFQKGPHDFVVMKTSSYNQVGEHVLDSLWTFVIRGGNDSDFSLKEKLAMKVLSFLPANPKEKAAQEEARLALENSSGIRIDLGAAKQDLHYYEKITEADAIYRVFIDKYMPQVYAGASGDFNIIHLDNDFGRSVGLGGYILHGMATMALGANYATNDLEASAIKRYKVRFSAPVKPCDVLNYQGRWSDDKKTFNFKAKNQAGKEVLNSAELEIF